MMLRAVQAITSTLTMMNLTRLANRQRLKIEELKAYLREHYTTPIVHRIEDIMLTKHSNGSDNLQYKADGKTYEVDGEFYVDKEYRLHHTHIFENGDEQEIIVPYKNGEHTL